MSERGTAAEGRINWRRILPILLTTTLVGGICGIFVINELDRQHDGAHLRSYTERALERALEISSAADQMLREMNAGSAPACSDQDLEMLRSIVLESRFMSDVGRISGDRVMCTGVGRLRAPWGLSAPDRADAAGTRFWSEGMPLRCRRCPPGWSVAATPSYSLPRTPISMSTTRTRASRRRPSAVAATTSTTVLPGTTTSPSRRSTGPAGRASSAPGR